MTETAFPDASRSEPRAASPGAGRRGFLRGSGLLALGAVGAGAVAMPSLTASAQEGPSDADILNFALNLEYLEAEYYLRAVFGRGLNDGDTTGTGSRGGVTGGRRVNFRTPAIRGYADEIARDEENHVQFIRQALGGAAVARPMIDLQNSFTAAARAAGLVGPNGTFDPFANENNFLLGAFIFEDVGVTAYKGAAPFLDSPDVLEAAAGILAVEAYHAGSVRTLLFQRGLITQAQRISDVRDSVDGSDNIDQGLGNASRPNLVPADANSLAFSRSADQVLNIVYLNPEGNPGGFFPNGLNGNLR